jgi:hypothetical protein
MYPSIARSSSLRRSSVVSHDVAFLSLREANSRSRSFVSYRQVDESDDDDCTGISGRSGRDVCSNNMDGSMDECTDSDEAWMQDRTSSSTAACMTPAVCRTV